MAVIKCVCGQQLSGADDDALFAALRTHSDEAHADLAITDEQLRQVLAARSRMSDWGRHAYAARNAPSCPFDHGR